METSIQLANKRDYFLVSFIGFSFGLFSLPILYNINLPFFKISLPIAIGIIVFFIIFANFALFVASFVGKFIPTAFQFAKFGAVGAFNSFLDWGILNLLIIFTGIATGFGFSTFKGISFILASISSYFWNKHWTFNNIEATNKKEVGKFAAVTVIGFFINIGLASLIVFTLTPKQLISPERLANIAAFSATIISLVWNFIGYKIFVFKK